MAEAVITALIESNTPIELRQSAAGEHWSLFVGGRQVSAEGNRPAMEIIRAEYERRRLARLTPVPEAA